MRLHNDEFEVFECIFEIVTPYNTRRQMLEAPRIMLERQFLSLVNQASTTQNPVKVAMRRVIPIYSPFDNQWFDREASIEFKNNAYINKYGDDN